MIQSHTTLHRQHLRHHSVFPQQTPPTINNARIESQEPLRDPRPIHPSLSLLLLPFFQPLLAAYKRNVDSPELRPQHTAPQHLLLLHQRHTHVVQVHRLLRYGVRQRMAPSLRQHATLLRRHTRVVRLPLHQEGRLLHDIPPERLHRRRRLPHALHEDAEPPPRFRRLVQRGAEGEATGEEKETRRTKPPDSAAAGGTTARTEAGETSAVRGWRARAVL